MYFPQPCLKGQNIFSDHNVEQTAKICPDYFSPIATIQGVVLFFI